MYRFTLFMFLPFFCIRPALLILRAVCLESAYRPRYSVMTNSNAWFPAIRRLSLSVPEYRPLFIIFIQILPSRLKTLFLMPGATA